MDAHSDHHVLPLKLYLTIFVALMVGTVLTVYAAYIELGWLNTPVALLIAVTKATLVVLFFMHVKYNPPLMWVFAAGGFFFLLILLALTLQDYYSRPWESTPAVEFLVG